jgi:4-hydroxybenzoate polyprenyltransferase
MNKILVALSLVKVNRFIIAHVTFYIVFFWAWAVSKESPTFTDLVVIAAYLFFYSGLYIINDLVDKKQDLKDVMTRNRPVASGAVTSTVAAVSAVSCIICSIVVTYLLNASLVPLLLILLVLNLLYTLIFKKLAYVDIFFVSLTQIPKAVFALGLFTGYLTSEQLIVMIPSVLVLYLAGAGLHIDKQRGRIAYGAKRQFWIGAYSERMLRVVQIVLYAIICCIITLFFEAPMMGTLLAFAIIYLVAQYIEPDLNVNNAFKKVGDELMKRVENGI